MPLLPSVQKDRINVSGGEVNVTPESLGGGVSGQLNKFSTYASGVANDYFIDEKLKFDRVRLIEAQNVMEGHKTRLQIDEKEGFQNKLGEQAFLYKDDEGRDLVTSYAEKFNKAAEDTITQLQLTPDQQNGFREMVAKDQENWTKGLREHQITQGYKYKESVLSNTTELAANKAKGSYQDIAALDDNLTTVNAAISEMGKQFGWSAAEVTNKIAQQYADIHTANLSQVVKSGNWMLAEAYLNKYSNQIPELNRHAVNSAIREMKEDEEAERIASMVTIGVQPNSNPAYTTSDPIALKTMSEIRPEEHSSISYKDPRLDAKTELLARELNMDWAKPLVTALRLAGEKSNNNQTSPAGAKGVMQFMPIAVEQVRRHTGKTIDRLNPEESLWGAFQFVDWISKKLNTKDPALIASYYNGGGQYVGQLKKGGVNAITNQENRNYVKRITSYLGGDYQRHISAPMIGDQLDPRLLEGKTPKQQKLIIDAHENGIKMREKAKEREGEDLYQAVIDGIKNKKITSMGQIGNDSLRILSDSQQKSIEAAFKAERVGQYDDTAYLKYLQNPTAVKNMSNAQFDAFLLGAVPPDKREGVAKVRADVTGRSIADYNKVQTEAQKKATATGAPKASIVTAENITKVLTRNAGSIGFSTGSVGTNKNGTALDRKGSSFWVATINDMTDRVREHERATGKNMTSAQIDAYVTTILERSVIKKDGQVQAQVYNPKTFKRKDVPKYVEDYILRNTGFGNIKDVPDGTFTKYYLRYYRGKK